MGSLDVLTNQGEVPQLVADVEQRRAAQLLAQGHGVTESTALSTDDVLEGTMTAPRAHDVVAPAGRVSSDAVAFARFWPLGFGDDDHDDHASGAAKTPMP